MSCGHGRSTSACVESIGGSLVTIRRDSIDCARVRDEPNPDLRAAMLETIRAAGGAPSTGECAFVGDEARCPYFAQPESVRTG